MILKNILPTSLKSSIYDIYDRMLIKFFPKKKIDNLYLMHYGHKMPWHAPVTINDKINWLKVNSDTSLWSLYSDKYRVRRFVEEKGLGHMLTKLYGVWETPAQIDFDALPERFVMKTNNGSGDVIIVKDKSNADFQAIRRKLADNLRMSRTHGRELAELHYFSIKPCIIAEEMLDETCRLPGAESDRLIDYKVWCFNGEPYSVMTVQNRVGSSIELGMYDLDWNPIHEHAIAETLHDKLPTSLVPRPARLDQMLDAARTLAQGFPQVRVDFYHTDGKVYFGEMTFTSMGGFMPYFTEEFALETGRMIDLGQ